MACLRSVYKPHSVGSRGIPSGTASCLTTISLGGALPRRSSSLPGAQGKRAASRRSEDRLYPCLTLLLVGVAWPRHCCRAGGLLHHRFTLAGCPAVCFCGPIQQVNLYRGIPRSGCYPAPCSVECGLSSKSLAQFRGRPTNLRYAYYTVKPRQRQRLIVFLAWKICLLPSLFRKIEHCRRARRRLQWSHALFRNEDD